MPRRRSGTSKPKALTEAEAAELVRAAERESERKELTVKGLLHFGLRADELAHARPDWFRDDQHPPYIMVPKHEPCQCRQCMYKAATNAKRWAEAEDPDEPRPEVGTRAFRREVLGRQGEMWRPKSDAGSGEAPATDPETWRRLRDLVEEHGEFPGSRTAVYKRVRSVAQNVDTRAKVTPHTLRHTFCMQAVRRGVTIENLKEAARHSSIESTQAYLEPEYDTVGGAFADAFGIEE